MLNSGAKRRRQMMDQLGAFVKREVPFLQMRRKQNLCRRIAVRPFQDLIAVLGGYLLYFGFRPFVKFGIADLSVYVFAPG